MLSCFSLFCCVNRCWMMQENVFGQIVSFGVPLTLNHYAEQPPQKGHNLPLSRPCHWHSILLTFSGFGWYIRGDGGRSVCCRRVGNRQMRTELRLAWTLGNWDEAKRRRQKWGMWFVSIRYVARQLSATNYIENRSPSYIRRLASLLSGVMQRQ